MIDLTIVNNAYRLNADRALPSYLFTSPTGRIQFRAKKLHDAYVCGFFEVGRGFVYGSRH